MPGVLEGEQDGQLRAAAAGLTGARLPAASHLQESQEARCCSVGTSVLLGSSSVVLSVVLDRQYQRHLGLVRHASVGCPPRIY